MKQIETDWKAEGERVETYYYGRKLEMVEFNRVDI